MSQGVIVIRNKGGIVPLAYLEKLYKTVPTHIGIAMVEGDKLSLPKLTGSSFMDAKEVMELQDNFKQMMIFNFQKLPKDTLDTDFQPFSLLDEKVAVFVEGQFKEFSPKDSKHTGEYGFTEDVITPKFNQLWRILKGDVSSFLEEIRGEEFRKDILRGVDTGSVTILTHTGEAETFTTQPKDKHEFPWGWVSQNFGYVEHPAGGTSMSAMDKFASAVGSAVGFKKKVVAQTPPPAPAEEKTHQEENAPEVKEAQVPERKEELPKKAVSDLGMKKKVFQVASTEPFKPTPTVNKIMEQVSTPTADLITPPPGLTNKQQKRWYRENNNGLIPTDWRKGPPIAAGQKKGKLKDFQEAGEGLKKVVEAVAKSEPTRADKDVSSHNIPTAAEVKTGNEGKAIVEGPLPIISAKAKKEYQEWLGTLDNSSQEIMSPEDIQKMEEKYPTSFDVLGINMEDTFKWPFDRFHEMCHQYPNLAAVMLLNYRAWVVSHHEMEDKGESTKVPTVETVAKSAIPGKKRVA